MTAALVPAKRTRRKRPAQVGNVVPLRPAAETTEDIVRDVQDRSRRAEQEITDLLRECADALEDRHRERARDCIPIGYAMDRPTLDDWIAIGQRMLAAKGGRVR